MGSGPPDVWWFRADGRKMTQRNWRDDNALTLGVFLNGAEIPTQSAQGAPVIDDTFLILFNAWEDAIVFTLPAVSFGRRWTHELSTAEPERRAGRGRVPGARRRPGRGALARRSSAGSAEWRELRAHLPAPAGAGARLPRGAGARPVPARPRRLAPLPLARRCRRAPARRTATTSSIRRGSRRISAARRSSATLCSRAGLGRRARHRPEPHGRRATRTRSGATRSGARSSSTSTGAPACTAASSTSASSPACGWRTRRSGRSRTPRSSSSRRRG